MNSPLLATVEVQTGPKPTGSVLWLHGLGADGHDFEPVVPHFARGSERQLRFVFPHAPIRPVTMAGGTSIRAWYDIIGIDRTSPQDEAGVRASAEAVRALIRRENERGIATEHIVLGGFSQGGAMALYIGTRLPERLAGIVGLSTYLPVDKSFQSERDAANQSTPIFMAHGSYDGVVPLQLGELSHATLAKAGYSVEWHRYPIAHEVSMPELEAIAAFLKRVL